MRLKALRSPGTCFVVTDRDDLVLAYLLAYPDPANQFPPLGTESPSCQTESVHLLLHGVVVNSSVSSRERLNVIVKQAIETEKSLGYHTILRVAIQQASSFWSKTGFV